MTKLSPADERKRRDEFLTPESKLFVKHHLGEPDFDPHAWELDIKGMVTRPKKFSLPDLQQLPQFEIMAFHKCAGSPIDPNKPTPRDVGNVIWSGARLKDILDLCRPMPFVTHVWSEGADFGSYRGAPSQFYAKDLPISKITSGDVIIADKMNGEALSNKRGGPVRLVAPGYYATNSVKWLKTIQVEDRRSTSLFTTDYYNDKSNSPDGEITLLPVWDVKPDSVITEVSKNKVISGWAWGNSEIAQVEVSIDFGRTWRLAEISNRKQYSWQKFTATLPQLHPGVYFATSRAHDKNGLKQPKAGTRNSSTSFQFCISG